MSHTATEEKTPLEPSGAQKPPLAFGDRIFSGLALTAGLTIMVALAGVFVFLAIEGYPGLSVDEDVLPAGHHVPGVRLAAASGAPRSRR